MARRRPTGRGGGGGRAAPQPPPPNPPPSLIATGATLRPPRSRGDALPPPEGTATRGGGVRLNMHTAPSRLLPRGSRLMGEPTPARRSGARTKPGGGTRRAPEQYGGRLGAPRSSPRAAPHPPAPLGAGPRPRPNAHAGGECADDKRGAGVGNRGPPPGGGAGRPRRDPPPIPPTGPQAAGAPAPGPPEAGPMVAPPPAGERSRSTARPPAPAAGSHVNRGEQASPRQRARTPHRSRQEKAGEHEPERYGGHGPHDQNETSDTRFVACPGKAEGRNEAERPPALLAPWPHKRGARRTGRPTPPPNPPHGGRTAGKPGRGEPGPDRPPAQARQTEHGTGAGHAEGHGPRGTALPAPSAGTA